MTVRVLEKINGFKFEMALTNVRRLSEAMVLATRGVRAVATDQVIDEEEADGLVELAQVVATEADALWSMWSGDERKRHSLLGGIGAEDRSDTPTTSPATEKIIDLCAEWHALFDEDWPGTEEAGRAICRRLTSIEEELAGEVPASIPAAVAMMGVALANGDDVGSNTNDLAILRATMTGLGRLDEAPPAAPSEPGAARSLRKK